MFIGFIFEEQQISAGRKKIWFVSLFVTHQRLSHDDADLALRQGGEVGKQTLEDVLARPALRVDADGDHGWGAFFTLRTADWRDGRFIVSVPHR